MPRKKPRFQVRTVYLSDPDPEAKQRIRKDLTAHLRPRLCRAEALDKLRDLRANRRRLSATAYENQREAIFAEARRDPKQFWDELGDAFDTYSQRARLRTHHRAVTARLRYVEKAQAALKPQSRLKSSRENLTKVIDRTGVMHWENSEFPSTPRVVLARIIAERATQNADTYRKYLLRERKRLTTCRKRLEHQAGDYLAENLRRGRRSNRAMREFIVSVLGILKRYLVPSGQWWQDVADVCRYFHPGRLTLPHKKDAHESLDTTFWFPTKEALRRLIRRT
jgi:hypothetical protein